MPNELVERAQVTLAHPVWKGRSAAQVLHEKRMVERRRRRQLPDWFSAEDVVWEPWEREAAHAV